MSGSGTGFGPAVLAWLEKKVDHIEDGMTGIAVGAGEDIARKTTNYIATRGTAKSGKQGRIETYAMINSVDSELVKDTAHEVEVRAGYHDAPYYTVFQELGTSRIEAMYALTDAAEEVLANVPKEIEGLIRSA